MAASTIDQDAIARTKEMTMSRRDRAAAPRPRSGTRGRIVGAVLAVLALLVLAAPTYAADWGLEPGSFHMNLSTTQAGGHPDVETTFNYATEPGTFFGMATDVPVEPVRDMTVDLPPGLVGNPEAYPTCRPYEFPQCPADTQVGVATVTFAIVGQWTQPVFNMATPQGAVAQFAFNAWGSHEMAASVRDGDHGLRLTVPETPNAIPILSVDMTMWGDPASPAHDHQRTAFCTTAWGSTNCTDTTTLGPYPADGVPSGMRDRAFMSNGAQCGVTGKATLSMNTWYHRGEFRSFDTDVAPLTGCDKETFAPDVSIRPASREAGAPTGLAVDINVPESNDPHLLATPPLKSAVVKLPAGMTLSPSAADGLQGCSDDQIGLGADSTPAACPRGSEIGTATIQSPLLDVPLTGHIYVGTPTPQQLVRLFLVVAGGNVSLKLPGSVDADPATGQLTTTFANLPQLAAGKISLQFTGGPRAVLSNPASCGTQTATADLTPWSSDQAVSASSSFTVDQGCDTAKAFTPSLSAGTTNPVAGASSPFTLTVTKPDGQPNIQSLDVTLPQGLLGRLSDVPVCAEAQAAAGTCGEESRIGQTTVAVGPGSNPVFLPQAGKAPTGVYLAGPYKGAPFSLVIKVPAQAGPYDLGTVVVRAALFVDANKAQVNIKSDPLPQMLQGFPLQYRTINITIDRAGFMLNPTSCAVQNVQTTVTSVTGASVPTSSRFQVGGCASTVLAPKFLLGFTGRSDMRKGGHPGLVADLVQGAGESGLRTVKVTLPSSVGLDLKNAQSLCSADQAKARSCPAASIVGEATVRTPALHQPLTGPVYFVEGSTTTATGQVVKTLPQLWLKLEGEGVSLDLWASSSISHNRIVSTFDNIPDAPIDGFQLKLNGGQHGILMAGRDVCATNSAYHAVFTGQTGKVVEQGRIPALGDCPLAVAKTTTTSRSVTLRLSGVGVGTLEVGGSQVIDVTRTIKSAHGVSVTTRLTAAARRALSRHGHLRVKLVATFTLKGAHAGKTITKTVTLRRQRT